MCACQKHPGRPVKASEQLVRRNQSQLVPDGVVFEEPLVEDGVRAVVLAAVRQAARRTPDRAYSESIAKYASVKERYPNERTSHHEGVRNNSRSRASASRGRSLDAPCGRPWWVHRIVSSRSPEGCGVGNEGPAVLSDRGHLGPMTQERDRDRGRELPPDLEEATPVAVSTLAAPWPDRVKQTRDLRVVPDGVGRL